MAAHIPYRGWLLILFLIALVIGCIHPHDTKDLVLEHLLTVAFVGVMAWHGRPRERALSNAAYTGVFVFMLLHVLGANYTYSLVPYDRWSASLFGTSVSEFFGWPLGDDGRPRNHYDRLVHFSFGSLMLPAAVEIGRRHAGLTGAWAYIYAACVLNVGSTGYELLEWLLMLVAAPEQAETYNGQQGDVWDAHKDVGLSALGTAAAVVVMVCVGQRGQGTGHRGQGTGDRGQGTGDRAENPAVSPPPRIPAFPPHPPHPISVPSVPLPPCGAGIPACTRGQDLQARCLHHNRARVPPLAGPPAQR